MSEDYMTGQQLRDEVFCPIFRKYIGGYVDTFETLVDGTKSVWDEFAARVKMPRPKPPPSLLDVYSEWRGKEIPQERDMNYAVDDLLSRLTAAKAAIDEWNSTHGKDAK